jgi:hypothetical protein
MYVCYIIARQKKLIIYRDNLPLFVFQTKSVPDNVAALSSRPCQKVGIPSFTSLYLLIGTKRSQMQKITTSKIF